MRLTVLGGCGAWPAAGQACSGYLVEQDGFRLLVDPGYAIVPRLLELIDAAEVDAVLVSHGHPDHCADLHPLLRAPAAPTCCSPKPPSPSGSRPTSPASCRARGRPASTPPPRVPAGCCSPTCCRARRPARPRTRPAPASPARWGSPAAAWSPTSAEPRTPHCPGPPRGAPQQRPLVRVRPDPSTSVSSMGWSPAALGGGMRSRHTHWSLQGTGAAGRRVIPVASGTRPGRAASR